MKDLRSEEVGGEGGVSDVKNFALFRDRGYHPFNLQVFSLANGAKDRQIEGEWPPFARLLTSHPSFSTSVSAQNSEALLLGVSFTSESNLLLLTVGLGVAAITLGTYIHL